MNHISFYSNFYKTCQHFQYLIAQLFKKYKYISHTLRESLHLSLIVKLRWDEQNADVMFEIHSWNQVQFG